MAAKSLTERISQFKSVHGDRYDYSKLPEHIRWDSKVPVICPHHGEFLIIVNNHHRGAGCPECAGVKKLTISKRIKQARMIHGDKYDYSLWPENAASTTRVNTICSAHGEWNHTLASHINRKSGCPSCAGNRLRTIESFTDHATSVHGDKYDYSSVSDDLRNTSLISIKCKTHGIFTQDVSNHLAGKGCPSCGEYGYRPNKKGYLYALRSTCGKYVKVGITNNIEQRHRQLELNTPFTWECIHIVQDDDGNVPKSLEKLFHKKFDRHGLTGFDGATEWLTWNDDISTWFSILTA